MSKYKRIVVSIIVFILMFSLFAFTAYIEYKRTIESDIQTLKDKLNVTRTNLESNISSKIVAINGLKTYVELDKTFNQEEYENFAKAVYESSNDIVRNITFITDTTITHMYPYEESENIIGLDLAKQQEQKDLILYAKENNKTIITSPVDLVEGGVGIIVRVPVLSRGEYYGQVALIFDYNKTIEYSGLRTLQDDYFIKLKTTDNIKSKESIIWSNAHGKDYVFDYNMVSTNINMYNANLVLEAVPKHGFNRKSTLFNFIMLIGAMLSLLAAITVYRLMKVTDKLKVNKEELQKSYKDALDANMNLELTVSQLKDSEERLKAQYDEIKNQEEYIRFLAERDFLTDLYNRRKLSMNLEESIKSGKNGTIILIDIDDFKNINDTLGHYYGDKVLKYVSRLVSSITLFEEYTPYRIGGDEFVLHIPGDISKDRMKTFISYLFETFGKTHYIDNIKNTITASLGVVRYPENANSVDEIIMKADLAMYNAKKQGKNRYCYFEQSMIESFDWKISIEKELREAVENNLFYLMYQPIVDAMTGRFKYFEALIRIKDSNIPPNIFIPVAEETGLILKIGRWVIEEAMAQIKVWENMGLENRKISVNVSPMQVQEYELINFLRNELIINNIDPADFEIEITESVLLENREHNIKVLENIKELGIKIALDDFGTGYSSLSYLTYIPVDKIKLDKSLKDRFLSLDNSQVIKGLISLCHGLDLKVVVEGVETLDESENLKIQNVDYLQGYYFSKPMKKEDATLYIENDIKKD